MRNGLRHEVRRWVLDEEAKLYAAGLGIAN